MIYVYHATSLLTRNYTLRLDQFYGSKHRRGCLETDIKWAVYLDPLCRAFVAEHSDILLYGSHAR